MKYRAIAVLLAALTWDRLFACSPRIVVPHLLDPEEQKVDRNPPVVPELRVLKVVRGHDPITQHGDSYTIDTCADKAVIFVGFTAPPSDDRTPVDKLGVSWRILRGTPPAGLREPAVFEQLSPAQFVLIDWTERNDKTPVDFTMVVTVRDLAGNETTSPPLRVTAAGSK
jgi:hypothetical protein